MIELSLLYYLIKNKDEMLLLKLDENKFLDTKVRELVVKVKNYKEEYDYLPSLSDLPSIINNTNLFDNVQEISKNLVPFFLDQVTERHNKYKFFNSLYDILSKNQEENYSEIVSNVQSLLLDSQTDSIGIEDIDCSQPFEEEEFITRLPLGLGKFDDVNGGMAASELMLLGGYRGQGKSILALHTALSRFRAGKTVGFISIEMRASEVRFRLDAMVTGLPIKNIQFNRLSNEELLIYYQTKAKAFCKPSRDFQEWLFGEAHSKEGLAKAYSKLPRKKNKFFLYDLPLCNLSDINYVTNKLKKVHALNFLVVDYLNIIKVPNAADAIDWKTQLQRSEGLKTIARSNDIALLAPIQISDEGVVKFAKSIEDPVDSSIFFQKTKSQQKTDELNLYVSKIRNGTDMKFSLVFNKENLRVSTLRGSNDEY